MNGVREVRENSNFITMGDILLIHPFAGNKKKISLNRTEYELTGSQDAGVIQMNPFIKLPLATLRGEKFKILLLGKNDQNPLYVLLSMSGHPFKLNGHYVLQAYLEAGDTVEIGHNFLKFRKSDSCKIDEDSIDIPSSVLEKETSIYLEGETGVGKSRLAQIIHEKSGRKGKLVSLNLSAIPEGLIESEFFGHVKGAFTSAIRDKMGAVADAKHGTLFIDEIDSLPLNLQTKLLTFLDTKKYRMVGSNQEYKTDARFIFAAGQSLRKMVRKKTFRADLYYRILSSYDVYLRPLRDNPTLLEKVVDDYCQKNYMTYEKKLVDFYKNLPWPGNIRQLLSHLEKKRLGNKGQKLFISTEDYALLQEKQKCSPQRDFSYKIMALREMQVKYINDVFERMDKSIKLTAKILEISPVTLRRYLKDMHSESREEVF